MALVSFLSAFDFADLGVAIGRGDWKSANRTLWAGIDAATSKVGRQPPHGFELLVDWLASEEGVALPICQEIRDQWPVGALRDLAQDGMTVLACLNAKSSREVLSKLDKLQWNTRRMADVAEAAYEEEFGFMECYTCLCKVLAESTVSSSDVVLVFSDKRI